MVMKPTVWTRLKNQRATWDKIKWTWLPETNREAGDSVVRNFLAALVSGKSDEAESLMELFVLAGHDLAVLFLILILTGIPLMFLYVPSVERAYLSVKDIEFTVSFGWFLRGLHRVSAHLMVAVVFLHMVRVFLRVPCANGTARKTESPTQLDYWDHAASLTLLLSFTGYLLPGTSLPIGPSPLART